MSLGDNLNYYQDTEYAVGDSHPTEADTINRALKELIAKFDNGEADTQVYRNCINIENATDITVGVVNDDAVFFDTGTNKWIKADDKAYGIIDVDKQVVYIFGAYTLLGINTLVPGETYYVDENNPGQFIADNTSGVLVGEALSSDTILITAVSGGIQVAPPTEAPILSAPVSTFEQVDTDITITNYNATYDYVVQTTNGVANRVGNTITFTSTDIATNLNVDITVTAQNTPIGGAVSDPTVASINVLAIVDDVTDTIGTNDGNLLYTGATMNDTEYPVTTDQDLNIRTNKIRTSKIAYNAIAYTGNGSSQDITNSVEMNLNGTVVDKLGGQIWVKGRGNTQDHYLSTSIGSTRSILRTNTNGTASFNSVHVTNNNNGFSLNSAANPSNQNSIDFASWSQRTTKYTNGYTSDGTFYEAEWNPISGFIHGIYRASGNDNMSIPNSLGVSLDLIVVKSLTSTSKSWSVSCDNLGGLNYGTNILTINTTDTLTAATNQVKTMSASNFTVGTGGAVNVANEDYYFYGFANTTGKVKVGSYEGDGISGQIVDSLGFDPKYIIIKNIDAVADWSIIDDKRGNEFLEVNTTDIAVADSSIVLGTDQFTINATGGRYNASGNSYLYIAVADHDDFETTLYTGNGSTQDIINGLNMDWDGIEYPNISGGMSWFKSKASNSHRLHDSIRQTSHVASNLTDAEYIDTQSLTKFNVDGVTVGSDVQVNENTTGFINWSWGTTKQYSGLTSDNKPYTAAWNQDSGFVAIRYVGSGSAGYEIPTHLGKALDFYTIKNLDAVNNWITHSVDMGPNSFMYLDQTNSLITNTTYIESTNNDYISVGTAAGVNTDGDEYILYGWANSMTQEVLKYTGTGEAGNFIKTKKKPAYVMLKDASATSDWVIFDNKRNSANDRLRANTLGAEDSPDFIDIFDDGFVFNGAGYNTSGNEHIAFVMYETDEDTQGSKYYG